MVRIRTQHDPVRALVVNQADERSPRGRKLECFGAALARIAIRSIRT